MNELPPFIAFGLAHLSALIGIAIVVTILPLSARRLSDACQRHLALSIAIALFISEASSIIVSVFIYENPLKTSLPLHLCGIAALLTAWMLWQKSYKVYEIAYFWGMGGSIPAILTPDIAAGFPNPAFFYFFIGHGLTMLGVLHVTIVYGYQPRLRSVGKTVIASLILMMVVAPINLAMNTNYMYLCYKPAQATVMDYLGPWPWYILSLVVIGTVVFLVCYLPFAILAKSGNLPEDS